MHALIHGFIINVAIAVLWIYSRKDLYQRWPNCGARVACCSSNLCMLSEKLYICLFVVVFYLKV